MFPIHHTFAPHVTLRYCMQTLGILLRPWTWYRGNAVASLRSAIAKDLDGEVALFSSGRDALLALLRALQLTPGAEVIIQAYTCVVVPNAVQAANGVPIYADIDRKTLNLDPAAVKRAITHRTRAVICQHTFGIPSDIEALRTICDEHKILLIEDCAHIIPDRSGPEAIGKKGDAMILSFGRDKAISSISGGAALVRNEELADALQQEENNTIHLSWISLTKLLLYPLIYTKAKPLFGLGVGKAYLALCRALSIMPRVVTSEEKAGKISPILHTLPNALATLACTQWKRRKEINDHRRRLVTVYKKAFPDVDLSDDLPLQKFPLLTQDAEEIRLELKKKNIHLDDGWAGCTICPRNIDTDAINYIPGSAVQADRVGKQILSLPTHPTMSVKQAKRLIRELQRFPSLKQQ